ncbi:MAG: ABC transporter permease [Nitrospirae bacterium]|nr:ABC transporter permease [Nitrospirota bacterium]
MWRLLKKELLHILRDKGLLIFVIYAFSLDIVLAAKGFQLIPRNIAIAVYDESRSSQSRQLISKLQSPAFKPPLYVTNTKEIDSLIEDSRVVLALDIPSDFHKQLYRGGASVQVLVDGTQSSSAYLSTAYLARVVADYNRNLLMQRLMKIGLDPPQGMIIKSRLLFNPEPRDDIYEGLIEFFMVITLIGMILPAAVFIREQEYGTIEQIRISPLSLWRLVVFKVVASTGFMIVIIALSFMFVLKGWLGFPLKGGLGWFIVLSLLYSLSTTGLAFIISSIARRFSQIGLLAVVIFAPMILLSGGWVPPEALPEWLRRLTIVSPLKQFMDVGISMLIRGAEIQDLSLKVARLFGLGMIYLVTGLILYRRRLS